MAQRLVAGIYPAAMTDPTPLEDALAAHDIDAGRVKVVTKSALSKEHDTSPIDFVDVFSSMQSNSFSDDFTHQHGIMTDAGGTGVPGVGGPPSTSGLIGGGSSANYLSDFNFAADEVDNYNDAIEDGYAVVLADAGDGDVAALAASMKAAGLKNVRPL